MATVELVASGTICYFSIWRNGRRKIGDSLLKEALIWGHRIDAGSQSSGLADRTVAYGPVLEWSE